MVLLQRFRQFLHSSPPWVHFSPECPQSYSAPLLAKQYLPIISLIVLLSPMMSCRIALPGASEISPESPKVRPAVNVTRIQELARQPEGTPFFLEGAITRQVPLVKAHLYKLEDATGNIWVLSTQPMHHKGSSETPKPQGNLLQIGDQILIQGILRVKSMQVGSKEIREWYVEEQRQLFVTPASSNAGLQ